MLAVLRDLTPGVVAAPDGDVLRALVRQLATALGVAYAFVAECAPDGTTARVRALWSRDRFVEGVTYPLAGTPCLGVHLGQVCTYPSEVRTAFPDDPLLVELSVESYVGAPLASAAGERLGWLAVMDRQPITDPWFTESVVALFTVRAAAELDRRHGERALRTAQEELSRDVAERTHALRLSEEKFAKAFRASPNALTIARAADGRFLEVNDTFLRWHGLHREDVIGRTAADLGLWADPADRERLVAKVATAGSVSRFEFWFRRGTGEPRRGMLWAERLEVAGEQCLLVEVSDVTQHRAAETARRESESRLQAILDNTSNVVWVKDVRGRHVLVNRRFETLFAMGREAVIGRCDEELFPADVAQSHRSTDVQVLQNDAPIEFEGVAATADGQRAFLVQKFLLRDGADRVAAVCGIATDITERKRAEERLVHDAFHDALTGLPNRALFLDRLGQAVERARRHTDQQCAVLFLDLDRFKLVNDGLGHVAGDQLLMATARALETCLRPEDTVARLGGDEFAILLDDVRDASDATRVAERIQRALAPPVPLAAQQVFPSASIGIAIAGPAATSAIDLLRDADTAMYRAKAAGRACVEVFDAAMHAQAVALLRLETELREAVARAEFLVHYQPILAAGDGRIVGYEALLRWAHPTRGLLEPAEFLAVAEDTGLIVPIGHWVLAEACRQVGAWQQRFPADPPLVVSINLCSRQFLQPDLVDRIREVLAATGVDPRSLMLEITESVLMDRTGAVTQTLERLRELRIRLSIDDFGTGYSSLSYLHRFPIDVLKIDRAFVGRVACGHDDREIVRTIVTLAHTLAKDVIAEGVETSAQLSCLRKLGCDYVQGYLFARTLDAAAAGRFLRERHAGAAADPIASGPSAPGDFPV